MPEEVVIVGARRTAVGSFKGGLSTVRAAQLGAVCIRQLLADANNLDPSAVDEVRVGWKEGVQLRPSTRAHSSLRGQTRCPVV